MPFHLMQLRQSLPWDFGIQDVMVLALIMKSGSGIPEAPSWVL